MQRVGASYVGKKLYDYLKTQPDRSIGPETAGPGPDELGPPGDELDGQPFHDEDGQPLGTAFRLADVAVYVVFDGYGDPDAELERCLAEPETRIFWQTQDGRISAVIYVPDPSRAPARPQAMRADDI